MKQKYIIMLVTVLFSLIHCSVPDISPLASVPGPPQEWNVIMKSVVGCPDITGRYALIPKVATLQQNGAWLFSTGNWVDFALLIPFERIGIDTQMLKEKPSEYFTNSLVFKSNTLQRTLRVTSPVRNTEESVARVLKNDEGHYACEAGRLVFPEFLIRGGTEGSVLSGRIYRRAGMTSAGDLLFYEQVQGQKTVHTYYLFQKETA